MRDSYYVTLATILRKCMGAVDENGADLDIGEEVRALRVELDEKTARINKLVGQRNEAQRLVEQRRAQDRG